MTQMIATQFSMRAKVLKGDLANSGAEITRTPPQPLPMVSRLRRPPPGLPVTPMFGTQGGLPSVHEEGGFGGIGDVVTQLRTSIVGCHRETVKRETGLENCPSSNLHQFVPQVPHSRHEFIPPSMKSTMKRGNNQHVKISFTFTLI